ncbi:two-component system phosphate regulon sensor histidine kinase PhoR [Bacillus thermophilus]|uniref:histidine kinase n=1 Tax=Siminovitchia thermophila TaxID=1245522 RepID=A0ABS2R2H6_9BACI|nr:ATP-binding protein [Siminovitchia thermophila]MBM7713846.1 two-component system phosphate regulon sensor histidine kinase PhoR [Siminovitchia thermophila]
MQKLWLRITFSFLLLMSIALLVSGFFIADKVKDTYMDLKKDQLYEMAQLTVRAINTGTDSEVRLQEQVKELSKTITSRITVIDRDGHVLADSEDNPSAMENHADRPEVRQIIKSGKDSGISIRYSKTLGYNMMYVTIPMIEGDQVKGVVRTSLSLEKVEQAIEHLTATLTFVLFTAMLLTTIVGVRMAKGIAKPIEEMITVSERLKDKDYSARVRMQPKGELGRLANAINVLAASLKSQMEQIQENEQQLMGVLTYMKSGVLLVDKDGRILLANRAMGDMLGLEPETLKGKLHVEVGKSADLSRLIDQCLLEGKEIRDEIQFYFPDERILDAHLAPYVGKRNELKGIVAVLHDITDIRRLEKMRSEFVANVSHELKTPITSVKGFAETLLDGAMDDEELLHDFLNIIHKESVRLHRLINDILHLSKIEQHLVTPIVEEVNVTEVIRNVAETIRKEVKTKGLELELPDNTNVWVEGERDRIQQIILNLVSNAVVYTPEGGKISVSVSERENEVDIRVQDNGIGISKKDLPRIFERFYRVDKARARDSGGTGLGLAIVKHLIESHHGSIKVESEEGEGTIFTVTLPKKQANM